MQSIPKQVGCHFLFKGQNESFLYFSICSCSNIMVSYALDNFAEFAKRNRAVNDSN